MGKKINLKLLLRGFSAALAFLNPLTIVAGMYDVLITSGTALDVFFEVVFQATFFGNLILIMTSYFFMNYKKNEQAGRINWFQSAYLISFLVLTLFSLIKFLVTLLIQDLTIIYHTISSFLLLAAITLTFLLATQFSIKIFKSTSSIKEGDARELQWSFHKPVRDERVRKINLSKVLKTIGSSILLFFFIFSIFIQHLYMTGRPPIPADAGQFTPYLFMVTVLVSIQIIRYIPRRSTRGNRILFMGFLIIGGTVTFFNALPSLRVNSTIRSVNTQFSRVFGDNWADTIPAESRTRFRHAPY
ncbi:MAG: hypothetical protein ACTSUE_06850, partial [Promethearchaeota archaeon]